MQPSPIAGTFTPVFPSSRYWVAIFAFVSLISEKTKLFWMKRRQGYRWIYRRLGLKGYRRWVWLKFYPTCIKRLRKRSLRCPHSPNPDSRPCRSSLWSLRWKSSHYEPPQSIPEKPFLALYYTSLPVFDLCSNWPMDPYYVGMELFHRYQVEFYSIQLPFFYKKSVDKLKK
jgi:hypothetical protein